MMKAKLSNSMTPKSLVANLLIVNKRKKHTPAANAKYAVLVPENASPIRLSTRKIVYKIVILDSFELAIRLTNILAVAAIVTPKLEGSENSENFLFTPVTIK